VVTTTQEQDELRSNNITSNKLGSCTNQHKKMKMHTYLSVSHRNPHKSYVVLHKTNALKANSEGLQVIRKIRKQRQTNSEDINSKFD
jgi:hypothetical protein